MSDAKTPEEGGKSGFVEFGELRVTTSKSFVERGHAATHGRACTKTPNHMVYNHLIRR